MDAKRKKKVLVIDDDPFACSQIAQSLQARGFEVITVSEPDEAVGKAKEIVPDLVFCSLVLPVSNGLKIIKSIHSIESLKKVPSVMLISYAGELDPKYTAPLGIVDVIVKPLNPKEIVSKTVKVLGEDTGVIKIIAKEPPLKKEYETFTLDDEPETFEIKEEELIMESGESIEPLEAEIVEQTPEDDFSKLFEESPEEDVTQEYKPEELGSVSTAFPDKTPDIGEIEEESDIPEKDTSKKADETSEFLSEEEKYPSRKKSDPVKKIAIITASVITIAALSFGALKIFQKDKGKEIPSAVQKETQPEKSPLTKETVKETIPMDDEKTKEIVLETETAKPEKKSIPPKDAEKTDKPEQIKPISKKPLEKKESKAPAEKMRDLYSVQLGVFENENNAVSFADKLKQKGYDAFLKKETTEKKTLYRVLIGKFSENKKAVEQSQAILQKEGIKSIVYHH